MLTAASVLDARFTVTRFREGYDQDEVTAFLLSAGAALAAYEIAAGTVGLSADDVVQHGFSTTKFDNGFDQDEVDALLDDVVAALREHEADAVAVPAAVEASSSLVRSSAIPDVTFRRRRLRAGYSVTGVDGFLAAVRTVIAGYERQGMLSATPELTAADVLNVRFASTSFRGGYDQEEVAAYITEIIETLAYYERVAAAR